MARGIGGWIRNPPAAPPRDPSSLSESARVEDPPTARRGGGSSSGRIGRSRLNKDAHDPPDEAPKLAGRGGSSNGRVGSKSKSNNVSHDPLDDEMQHVPQNSGRSHIRSSAPPQTTRREGGGSSGKGRGRPRSNKKSRYPLDEDDVEHGDRSHGRMSRKAHSGKVRIRESSPPSSKSSTRHTHDDCHSENRHSARRSGGKSGKHTRGSSPRSSKSASRHPYDDHQSDDSINGSSGRSSVRISDNIRKARTNDRKSSRSSSKSATRHSNNDHYSEKSNKYSQGYPDNTERHNDDKYDYPLLDTEEEQYEQYQEHLYQQSHSQSSSQRQQQQQQLSSTHRKFNLAPIYDDIEMASLNKKKGDQQNDNDGRQAKQKKKGKKSRTRRLSRGEESSKGNPLESHNQVLAYLESSDTDNSSHEMEPRRHEEFYNNSDEEEDESDDDDEERPLRKSTSSSRLQFNRGPPKSALSWSEKCLNRSLVLAFAFGCFLFIRDHTSWWKQHEQRVALQEHHHHHNIDNTDDDDLKTKLDPMAVYNSNDDDSTHTRDHDPLNKYAKFTKDHGMDKHAPVPPSKYQQATAGKRISDRPGAKSLHHGFMDEDYTDRPKAEHSGSNAAELAGVRNEGNEIDEEQAAFLESVIRSPTKKKKPEEVSSSNVADDGDGEKEDAADVKNDHGQVISSPPLPPPTNDKVPIQVSTGSELGGNDGESSTQGDFQLGSDGATENPPPSESVDTPLGGEISQPRQGALSSSGNYEATSNGSEASANPGKEMPRDGREPIEMPWDGNDLGYIANTEIADNPGEDMPPLKNENEPAQSSPVVDYPSSAQQTSSGNSDNGASSNGSSVNTKNTPPPFKETTSQFLPPSNMNQPIVNQALGAEEVKTVYKDTYYRWNHPLRPVAPGDTGKDVPVFWRIPRSASGTVEAVMSFCYRNVLASSMGILAGHDQDQTLDVVTLGTGAQYVNVDMSRPDGIQRAKAMNIGSSGLADVISTPFLFEAADVFSNIPETGKCFTLLRHPADRAISLYHNYQTDESGNPNTAHYKGMSIDEYADQVAENNWMVRFLANKRSGSLNWHDLEAAKEVFGRKCLVGLVDKAEESLRRYERFFGWDKKVADSDSREQCLTQYLKNGDKRKEHPTYEGTAAWEALRKKNEYDCLLYEFAQKLYTQQTSVYEKLS